MNKYKILFVDDEEIVRQSLQRALFNTDYDITTANNGYEGLELVKEHEFAIVVSDFRMPELDGVEFLRLVSDISPDSTRILLTGYANMDVVIKAINEGHVYKFIEKPWKDEDLPIEIQKGLEYYEMRKKIQKQNRQLKEWKEKLEEMLDEKTKEIQKKNEILNQKNRELEARDRILEFILDPQPLEDSLKFIITEIMDIIPINSMIVYMKSDDNSFKPRFGLTIQKNRKSILSSKKLEKYPPLPNIEINRKNEKLTEKLSESNRINDYSFVIPVVKQHDLLGFLLLDNTEIQSAFDDASLKTVSGFISLIAIVINDHIVTSSSVNLNAAVKSILQEL